MTQRTRLAMAAPLVLLGMLLLGYSLLTQTLGWPELAPWRLWPLAALGVGLAVLLPPVLAPGRRELAILFPLALPLLAAGGLSLATLVATPGFVWGHFWPQVVLALALGLALLAWYLRRTGPWLPAIVLALIGAALQFSALTGWWSAWAVLWAVAPFGLGLWLLLVGVQRRSLGLGLAGGLTSWLSLALASALAALLTQHWFLINPVLALTLITVGAVIVAGSQRRSRPAEMATVGD